MVAILALLLVLMVPRTVEATVDDRALADGIIEASSLLNWKSVNVVLDKNSKLDMAKLAPMILKQASAHIQASFYNMVGTVQT